MKNYLLTVSYDGTDFHGWQRQKNQLTVQEAIENALSRLVGAPVSVTASGRTDEGVHALGQTVTFECETGIPAANLPAALNPLLTPSVRALRCEEAPDGFCARRSAKRKTYAYSFYLSAAELPPLDRFALRIDKPLDTALLGRACEKIVGTHDFAKFYCLGSSAKTTVRTVYSCSIRESAAMGAYPATYRFEICGDGFLYKMVRLIVGALLKLNCGKISFEDFCNAIDCKRDLPKVPAPSRGLTLCSVVYGGA